MWNIYALSSNESVAQGNGLLQFCHYGVTLSLEDAQWGNEVKGWDSVFSENV